jgi:hypothetical protein
MSKQYKLLGSNGLYFVSGQGFSGKTVADATVLSQANIDCLAGVGFTGQTAETKSYAVVYIRQNDAVSATSVSKKAGDISQNQLDPSKRRFASFKEAAIHAGRFHTRRARRTDSVGSGSAGHVGAFVIETSDPVNSAVNLTTGLTNSLK